MFLILYCVNSLLFISFYLFRFIRVLCFVLILLFIYVLLVVSNLDEPYLLIFQCFDDSCYIDPPQLLTAKQEARKMLVIK